MRMGRLPGDKLLYIKQSDLRAVLLQEPEQILGFEPYGGGIVIGVYTDQAGVLQKDLSSQKVTLCSRSLSRPRGVTAPGIKPSMSIRF